MIKPTDLDDTTWEVISAAWSGDAAAMRRLLAEDPKRSQTGYFYSPPIHFAVREGHLEIVRMLLDAGADSEENGIYDGSLVDLAKERGHDAIANLLEETGARRGRTAPSKTREDHPIHIAAQAGDVPRVRALLDEDPSLVHRGDRTGGTPLHRATAGSAHRVIELLIDRGADIHAIQGSGNVQAIDIALWGGFGRTPRPPLHRIAFAVLRCWLLRPFRNFHPQPHDAGTARLLVSRGATCDITVATALGDIDGVRTILDKDPDQIRVARPNGRRALTTAVEFQRDDIAGLLLERGADPTWPELNAEKGGALHAAARAGNRTMVELLLAHGADPNGHSDSAGNAVFAAKTPEIRAILEKHGGSVDPYDLVWMDEDDEVMRRVTEDPKSAELGCGGVFTAVVTRGKRDLLQRLLAAGIRVPDVVTGCQSYLLEQPDMLRTLLDHGMNPDTCSWERQTMLHMLCRADPEAKEEKLNTQRAAMLLDAGASISARDDQFHSTPLAWAARNNNPGMVRFLLSRGAPMSLPDDKPWATPLAWATRRGHAGIVRMLQEASWRRGL